MALTMPQDVDALLAETDEAYNWLVPDLIEVGDRFILTGWEGSGKSHLLRQMGLQIAGGISPFSLEEIEPRRVLILDLENSKRQVKRLLHDLRPKIELQPGYLQIACWPQGINLTRLDDAAVVRAVLEQIQPEILILGPMYKMAIGMHDESISAQVAALLDTWRTTYGCALFIESHQPHTAITDSGKFRPERPFGSSLWLRWPEFGICLETGGILRHWRGQREEREWPEKIYWGRNWPWESGAPVCLQCGEPLRGNQYRFCSDKHSNSYRQAKFRAKRRGEVDIEDSVL